VTNLRKLSRSCASTSPFDSPHISASLGAMVHASQDYKERLIEVAFNPKTCKFDVADAAIRRDPEWITNISDMWSSKRSSRKIVNDYIDQASRKSSLTDEEEEVVAHNLDRLFDISRNTPSRPWKSRAPSMKNRWPTSSSGSIAKG
jgi:hypothetical protein